MAKVYTPQGFNDTTQFPETITFTQGKKENMPFGVTIPEVADASAVTGLDTASVQLVYDATTGGLALSPTDASTYTVTFAADV